MRKLVVLVTVLTLGPNPDAGDGVPTGSSPNSPNGPGSDMVGVSRGPAPNSGDGIPDGIGF